MLDKWLRSLSLRARATGISLLVTCTALVVVSATSIYQIRQQIVAEQHRSADAVALSIARASAVAHEANSTRDLAPLLRDFLQDNNLSFAAIYDQDDRLLTSAVNDQHSWHAYSHDHAVPEGVVIGQHDADGSRSGGAVQKAHDGDIARVVVGLSAVPSLEIQAQQSRMTLLAALATGAAGAIALFSTLGAWMRRLDRVARASESISRGDFSGSIADEHHDEIGRLARSFDSMAASLAERNARLHDFTNTLQDQVKQRTRELEAAVTAAQEASRTKSLFLANMSHELRTPLNGVIGMVDLLLLAGPNATQERYCKVAKASAQSLLELINEILDFSKIEAGKLELDPIDFDLQESIESVAQIVSERAHAKGLELLCSLGPDLPGCVNGDSGRLRQVLLNLLSNAIKFTARGEVILAARLQDQTPTHAVVRFAVTDSGIGIPADRLGRLFQSFSQVDASTTRKYGGTGLGLAISQRIVQMMNGQIGVESVEGKGATFWFTVKFEKRGNVATRKQNSPLDPRGIRVLAVDDNQTNREILKGQLTAWTFNAEVAEGAAQAMELAREAGRRQTPFRLAILDMHMPDTDGVQLARMLKADPLTRDTILISLSAFSNPLSAAQMREIGFVSTLSKPVMPSQLFDALVSALGAGSVRDVPDDNISSKIALPRLSGIRVLLAEDNEVNQFVASELLKQAGCECTVVVNGREAVAAALLDRHDVVLMDCQMPEMDGFEATRQIRAAEAAAGAGRHRPIIALTANAIKGDAERCLDAGMDRHVTKPIDPAALLGAIASLVGADSTRENQAGQESKQTQVQAANPGNDASPSMPGLSSVSAAPPVDLPSLERRCMGNRKIAHKALAKFQASMAESLPDLGNRLRSGDGKGVAASAHKIKGAAANVSAEEIRRLAGELEQLAKNDGLQQAEDYLQHLGTELNRLRDYLHDVLPNLNDPSAASAVGPAVKP